MYFSYLTSASLSYVSPCLSSPLINSCDAPHGTSPFRQGGVVDYIVHCIEICSTATEHSTLYPLYIVCTMVFYAFTTMEEHLIVWLSSILYLIRSIDILNSFRIKFWLRASFTFIVNNIIHDIY